MNAEIEIKLSDLTDPSPRDGNTAFRIRRACRKVFHMLLPRGYTREVVCGGVRFRLNMKGVMGQRIIKEGHWERDQIVYFFNAAKRRRADVFIDIGANFGYYSLLPLKPESLGIFTPLKRIQDLIVN